MNDAHAPPSVVSQPVSGATSLTLLCQVQARDPAAWQRLVRLYSPLVFHWCRKAGLTAEDSGDVVQDVFLAVAGKVTDFRREAVADSFRGWLRGICRFKVADHFRSAASRPTATGGDTAYRDMLQVAHPAERGADEDDPAADRAHLLAAALELVRNDFAPATWEAFRRYAVQGQPATEVAKELGIGLDSVYQAKARIFRRLRDEFMQLLD